MGHPTDWREAAECSVGCSDGWGSSCPLGVTGAMLFLEIELLCPWLSGT